MPAKGTLKHKQGHMHSAEAVFTGGLHAITAGKDKTARVWKLPELG